MASGDVVNGISSGAGVALTFQPAAGVECMISMGFLDADNNSVYLYDGVDSVSFLSGAATNLGTNLGNFKMFINNTRYFHIIALGGHTAYTGIQIK